MTASCQADTTSMDPVNCLFWSKPIYGALVCLMLSGKIISGPPESKNPLKPAVHLAIDWGFECFAPIFHGWSTPINHSHLDGLPHKLWPFSQQIQEFPTGSGVPRGHDSQEHRRSFWTWRKVAPLSGIGTRWPQVKWWFSRDFHGISLDFICWFSFTWTQVTSSQTQQ